MSNNRRTLLWFLIVLLMFYSPLFAQRTNKSADREKRQRRHIQEEKPIPTEEQVLRALDRIISHGDNITTADELGFFMANFPTYVDSVKSQKIAQKIMDIPELESFNREYPKYAYQVTASKLSILRHFREFSGVREYVLESLKSQIHEIRAAAAATLLTWGEWELAAPVLRRYKAYSIFQRSMDRWTEEQILEYLDNVLSQGDTLAIVNELVCALYPIGGRAATIKSKKVVQKILDIPEFKIIHEGYPQSGYFFTKAKVGALRPLRDFQGVREYVVKSLDHQASLVQIKAASILLFWGEWDLAAPVIRKNEAYLEIQHYKDERAIALLEEGTKSGGWKGRLLAAIILDDSTRINEVALDVLLHAPIDTDDEDINQAKRNAICHILKMNFEEVLPGLIRLAYDNSPGINSMAVDYLLMLSRMGHQEATEALIDIRDHHPDANIREQAKKGIAEKKEK